MSNKMNVEWFGDKAVLVITDVNPKAPVKAALWGAVFVGSVWVTAHEYFKQRQLNQK